MCEVTIAIPDDGWFQSGCGAFPKDKQLCVVIYKYGGQTPGICQFRKADWLHGKSDYFLEWEPSFAVFGIISKWKPLGLPEDDDKRLVSEIEKWFEE